MIQLKTLLFEVSIDQLKTQFVDTGKITDSEFVEIIDSTGGKSAYATWLTKMVVTKIIKPEDLYKYNAYFKIFDRRKREYPFQDINQYKTPQDIAKFIETSVEISNKEQRDPSQQKGVAKADKYAEFRIGSVDGFDVYKLPKDRRDLYGASCELGSGTEWCTATGKTDKLFKHYIKAGPLFIFLKPGSDEKYQFSYEEEQFMDKNDNSVFQNHESSKIYNLFRFIELKYPEYKTPFLMKLLNDPKSITPDDLKINRNLRLNNSSLNSLPDNLSVNGTLDISNTNIDSLPKNLQLKNYPSNWFVLFNTPLSKQYSKEEIQKMITDRGGDYIDLNRIYM